MKTYKLDTSTLDPKGGPWVTDEYRAPVFFPHAQQAVDAARAFVKDFPGPHLPRATVTSLVPQYRNRANAPRLMFRAWRKLDGTCMEERMDGK